MGEDLARLRSEQDAIISGLRKTQDKLDELKLRNVIADELGRLEGQGKLAGFSRICKSPIARHDGPSSRRRKIVSASCASVRFRIMGMTRLSQQSEG